MQMEEEKVTVLDMYNMLKDIVNKYPYYQIEVFDDMLTGLVGTKQILPKAYVNRKARKLLLKTIW